MILTSFGMVCGAHKESRCVQQNWVLQFETSFGVKFFQCFMQERAFKVMIAPD